MRAAIWHGPRRIAVEEIPRPEVGDDELLLRIEFAGICGSELSAYLGQNSLRHPPLIMGHEFTGTIERIGARVTAFAIGERVTVNPMVPDGTCVMCRNGHENLCLNRSLIGAHRPGAFAEYVAVPAKASFQLPDTLDNLTGTLVEPLACAVRAVSLAGVTVGGRFLILGAGPIGLLALAVARRAGASVIAIADVNPARLAVARSWGATHTINPREENLAAILGELTGGLGCDYALDAVGLPVTRRQAVEAVRPDGRVIVLGLHEDETSLPINTIVRSEISVQGSFCYSQENFTTAIRLLEERLLPDAESWLTMRTLEEANDSFVQLIDAPADITKVVLQL